MIIIKNIIGVVAVGLVLVGYVPYIRDILRGTTRPHVYSWFLWMLVTGIAFALQITNNAGAGALVTLAAAVMCIVVLFLGIRQGKKDITRMDTVFLFLAFFAIIIWLLAKKPTISMILVTIIDVLAFAPTVRKSWKNPYSETFSFYLINNFRFALAVVALKEYTLITALYPITWCLINGSFALMLITRRKQLNKAKIV